MSQKTGTFTLPNTGLIQLILPFTPTFIELWVGGKSGDADDHISLGRYDGTNQHNISKLGGAGTLNASDKVIRHREMQGGVPTVVLEAAASSFTTTPYTGIKLNVTVANANYQVNYYAHNL